MEDNLNQADDLDFSIEEEAIGSHTQLIKVQGELDVLTAPNLKRVITRALDDGKHHLIIDFSDTSFIDSTTLGVMIGALKRLRLSGGNMALVCSDPAIIKLIQITGLHRVFEIKATVDQAKAHLETAS